MKSKIQSIRSIIKQNDLDGYIITSSDEFLNQYPPSALRRLEYVTNFVCSRGYLIITTDKTLFITDARYTKAASDHFEETEIHDIKNLHNAFLYLKQLDSIGYNPKLFTSGDVELFKPLPLVPFDDIVDTIWPNKPLLPDSDPYDYGADYSGEDSVVKISKVRDYLSKIGAEALVICSSDSICWLLNVRGSDNEFSPIIMSYLYFSMNDIILFTSHRKTQVFLEKGVKVQDLESLDSFLANISHKILVPRDASIHIQSIITQDLQILTEDPILFMRSIKNDTEIEGAKQAHILDAVCVIEFFAWFYKEGYNKTEYELGLKMTEFRTQSPKYLQNSFAPIVGFGPNAAKMHYKASKSSALRMQDRGLLLIDSGGHYLGGTTDITRTIVIGDPDTNEKLQYTRVLKGHIALATIKFPDKGIKGGHLDILARQYLWQSGFDYSHGTGHGVGNCLSVHEGPVAISLHNLKYDLKQGMIMSNEPGYYEEDSFGIRIENLQYTKQSRFKGFLEFEQLTLVPYCANLVACDMLSKEEKLYIENYYSRIKQEIMPLLSPRAKEYLIKEMSLLSLLK